MRAVAASSNMSVASSIMRLCISGSVRRVRSAQMNDERRTTHRATDNRQRAWRETGDGDDDEKPRHAGVEVTLDEGTSCVHLPKISNHEPCGLVNERSHRFVRKHFRMVQDRCMRQRLYRCHAHKRRKLQVDGAKLIAVALEVGPEQGIGFSVEGQCVLESPRTRNLLREHAM